MKELWSASLTFEKEGRRYEGGAQLLAHADEKSRRRRCCEYI
jgi:hypothetical protein